MSKKVITFGEIMLRLATPDYLRFCQANQFNATFGGGSECRRLTRQLWHRD